MYEDFLQKASRLHSADDAFVVATVVRCEPPTSGKPGDRAIVTRDGKISGWIGGGCAQPIVIEEALKSLKDGKPRLIRVSPTAGAEPSDGITGFTMMCHSGGTLDIFIEPVLAKPHLFIFGRSPVAVSLAQLGKALSYRVSSAENLAGMEAPAHTSPITSQTAIIVATQGEDDEGALEKALATDAPYIAFVASKKKWEAVSLYLREKGIPEQRLKSIRVPAGLDIGARTPEEIAVSILAETIQVRRKTAASLPKLPVVEIVRAKDPVCGMMVDVATAKHSSTYSGQTIYFCCAPCKSSFDKDPSQFLNA